MENEQFPSLVSNGIGFATKLQVFPMENQVMEIGDERKSKKLIQSKLIRWTDSDITNQNRSSASREIERKKLLERQKWISEITEIGRQSRSIKSVRAPYTRLTYEKKS